MPRPKGLPKTGGRQKGVTNKFTADVKGMIVNALNGVGGVDYLMAKASTNPAPFLSLVGKVMPLTLAGDRDNPIVMQKHYTPDDIEALRRYFIENPKPTGASR